MLWLRREVRAVILYPAMKEKLIFIKANAIQVLSVEVGGRALVTFHALDQGHALDTVAAPGITTLPINAMGVAVVL